MNPIFGPDEPPGLASIFLLGHTHQMKTILELIVDRGTGLIQLGLLGGLIQVVRRG